MSPPPPERLTFEAFYARYRGYVRVLVMNAYWSGDPADDQEDIVQDVFVRAWRHYAKLKEECVSGWLRVVTRNEVVRRWRANRQHGRTLSLNTTRASSGDDDVVPTLLDRLATPENIQAHLDVADLVEHMPPDDLAVLAMWADGYRTPELAAYLHTSEASAQQRLAKARNRVIGLMPAA
jgi:RNA polymerase sigma factor (sigma-70 family)